LVNASSLGWNDEENAQPTRSLLVPDCHPLKNLTVTAHPAHFVTLPDRNQALKLNSEFELLVAHLTIIEQHISAKGLSPPLSSRHPNPQGLFLTFPIHN
jgi:hypothetical protein